MFGKLRGWAVSTARDYRHFGPSIVKLRVGRRLKTPLVSVDLRSVGPVQLRPCDSDLETFKQVFVNRQYSLAGSAQGERISRRYQEMLAAGRVPVIIDAGANVGAASIWFARMFPKAKIMAVEPAPENVALCRSNTASIDNVTVVEAAIGSSPGRVRLEIGDVAWAVQTTRSDGDDGLEIVSVDDLVARAGGGAELFIVKIDIEGFESDLFAANTGWVQRAFAIFVEPHDWLFPGKGTSASMQRTLFGVGFELLLRDENLVFVSAGDGDGTRATGRPSAEAGPRPDAA